MDERAFDALAKDLAANRTRRSLLRALGRSATVAVAGGGALARARSGEAAVCRDAGEICREHANCCSGMCNGKDKQGRRRCGCRGVADCPAATCRVATCEAGGVCASVATAPVDCVVSEWSGFGACSARCGTGGSQTRTRTVVTPASCGGKACPALSESQACSSPVTCGPCSPGQIASDSCSTVTFVDQSTACIGGGTFNATPCCASDADCPTEFAYCTVSFTLTSGDHQTSTTVCQTDASKGTCSGGFEACLAGT